MNLPLLWITMVGVVSAFLLSQPAIAARPPSVEQAVKAVYLTKFTSYLDWPAKHLPPGAPIVICIIGQDPFGAAVDQAVRGEKSAGRPLVLRRFSSASDVSKCHIAYLGGTGREVSAAISAAGSNPVVTVTDSRNANISGVIHFQIVGGNVKFDIDVTRASRSGVGISSKLLGLARKIRREGPA